MRPLLLLALLCALPASAQVCMIGEYAQYKDKAATEAGLLNMAAIYCLNAQYAAVDSSYQMKRAQIGAPASSREASACYTDMSRMLDAATAAGKRPEFEAMTKAPHGCDATIARLKAAKR